MISFGRNIRDVSETLQRMPVRQIYDMLHKDDSELANRVRRLRLVATIDRKQYGLLKVGLPYFVCGHFNPAIRKQENFAYTEYFCVDIDHISDKGLNVQDLKQRLSADERVVLCFLSPGADGLKLLFRLSERCYDAGLYAVFYKLFVADFARQYHLEQVVDRVTCDVSRACFLSTDINAFFNAEATPVNLSAYINEENSALLFEDLKKVRQDERQCVTTDIGDEEKMVDPTDEVMHRIKQVLNPKLTQLKDKPSVFVPKELDEIMEHLKTTIEAAGIDLYDIVIYNMERNCVFA